jgi:hypothetical protein
MSERRKPFTIRGHHLTHVANGIRGPVLFPRELAQRLATSLQRDLVIEQYVSALPPDLANPVMDGIIRLANYARDTIGKTEDSRLKFEHGYRKFLEEPRSLPDDHPVELVAGQPDGICNGCAVGKHCSLEKNMMDDVRHIGDFVHRARRLGLEAEIREEVEVVKTSDSDNKWKVLRVRTTMGAVRRVLS